MTPVKPLNLKSNWSQVSQVEFTNFSLEFYSKEQLKPQTKAFSKVIEEIEQKAREDELKQE